jgi:hypothetical protein
MADLLTNLAAVAGAAGGENLYIEDTFSTYLYTGTGSTQTITNDIDLAGEGGLVWIKNRTNNNSNVLFDSERSNFEARLVTNGTQASFIDSAMALQNISSTGFQLSSSVDNNTGGSGFNYVSWTFRKAPKFFDIVTYTGTSSTPRSVAHNLGSTPGFVIMKRTDTGADWYCWHRSQVNGFFYLNATNAATNTGVQYFTASDTEFTFNSGSAWNTSGGTYVMYLFAHDAGGFGDDGEQNVISCGSYTGNGSTTGPVVTLGYEPQWLLLKAASAPGDDWLLVDNMRGFNVSDTTAHLSPNTSAQEFTTDAIQPTATGFKLVKTYGAWNSNGVTYIYIAIRRGPMKTPEAGTEVYNAIVRDGTGSAASVTGVGFPPDTAWFAARSGTFSNTVATFNRLIGPFNHLDTSSSGDENTDTNSLSSFDMDGNSFAGGGAGNSTFIGTPEPYVNWYFLRAPGFFDVVCYTGTGSATTFTHNLGVVPELMIVKLRTGTTQEWAVYHSGMNGGVTPQDFYMNLNTTSAESNSDRRWDDTAPTSTVFTVGIDDSVNYNGGTLVAYLFASLAGVSDIGSYTGNGTSVTVTTGFQPRFILVKRTDSTGNWIVGNSARGLVAGNDPALFLNSTAAETTGQDWVDVSATGFTVNETALNANVNTGTYIYLAIS